MKDQGTLTLGWSGSGRGGCFGAHDCDLIGRNVSHDALLPSRDARGENLPHHGERSVGSCEHLLQGRIPGIKM